MRPPSRILAVIAFSVGCSDGGAGPGPPETVTDTLTNLSRISSIDLPLKGQIVFSGPGPSSHDLFMVDVAGTRLRPLTSDSISDGCGVLSPNGMRIAFHRGGLHYTMNADRSDIRLVLHKDSVRGGISCPSWSNDSRKLAFISTTSQTKGPCSSWLVTVNADGTGYRRLRTDTKFSSVQWSHDDSRLLIGSNSCTDGGPFGFFAHVADTNGADIAVIPAGRWGMSWSPTSSSIAYVCHSQTWGICVANADGTGVRQLTEPGKRDSEPLWSPDGSLIAYRNSDGGVYTMKPDGSGKTMIVPPQTAGLNVAWSPDSKFFGFDCQGICTVARDGSKFRRLATIFFISRPSWSPVLQ